MEHTHVTGKTEQQMNNRTAVMIRRGFTKESKPVTEIENGKVVRWIQHLSRVGEGETNRFSGETK